MQKYTFDNVNTLLLFLTYLCLLTKAQKGSSLHEVHFSSWSGDRLRQFATRFINHGSDALECAAIGAKYLVGDQLLVFISRDQTRESLCFIATSSWNFCRQIRPSMPASCCIRAFVKSRDNCGQLTIQHRVDESTNFLRNWTEYAAGFGQSPTQNYWIGLRTLNYLTGQIPTYLRVRMKDWNNTEYWADYTSFSVADEANKFRLSVNGYRTGQGNLGDCMARQNNMMFSTIDVDNDMKSNPVDNCAPRFKGGWWYNDCHDLNPNGVYYTLPAALSTPNFADGINWKFPFGYYYSLMEFEMIIY